MIEALQAKQRAAEEAIRRARGRAAQHLAQLARLIDEQL